MSRARLVASTVRRGQPADEAPNPKAVANVTDLDSRLVHTRKGSLQGYNAQAVTTCEQVIVAGELTQDATTCSSSNRAPSDRTTLAAAGIAERPGMLLADSGYSQGRQAVGGPPPGRTLLGIHIGEGTSRSLVRRETQLPPRGVPVSQASTPTRLSASAIRTCCRWVLGRPR
jgi:hypothetical protein